MGRRIIIHAGFHKTGTTTLQSFLKANSNLLSDQFALWLGLYTRPLIAGAVQFAIKKETLHLDRLADYAELYLNEEMSGHNLDVVFSHEDLCGPLLTRSRVMDYDTILHSLPKLAEGIEKTKLFDEVIFYFSTRSRDAWIKSLYWHLVCHSRMVLTLKEFQQKFEHLPSNDSIIKNLRLKMPQYQFVTSDIEVNREKQFGILQPFIDLIDPKPEILNNLVGVKSRRVRPSIEILRELLKINQNQGFKSSECRALRTEILSINTLIADRSSIG